jgi:ABC-2 type transport system permease protein
VRRLRLRVLQVAAFVREGVIDVSHQPRLLLVLVLGPFLVLVVFGFGYKTEITRYRALFVVPEEGALAEQVEANVGTLDEFVTVEGIVHDEGRARAELADGDVDVVVIFPDDPLGAVLSGERATIDVVHDRLDPVERSAIFFAAELAVDRVNASALATIVSQGQELAGPLTAMAQAATASTEAALSVLRASGGTVDPDDPALVALRTDAATLALTANALDGFARDLQGTPPELADATAQLAATSAELEGLAGRAGQGTSEADIARMQELSTTVREVVAQVGDVDAEVLVQPFDSDVDSVRDDVGITDYYAPGAIILLLQHLGITLGSLTFVRDRRLGIVEVLQVAPVGRLPIVVGKLLSNLLLGGLVAAALVAMVVLALGVPLSGDVGQLAGLLAAVLAASLVVGFAISLFSTTDTQAVQWAMLVLLASLFFSGFFLSIDQLDAAARVVSWLLPSTWGIEGVQDVMLRGVELPWEPMAALLGGCAVGGALVLRLVRTRLGIR